PGPAPANRPVDVSRQGLTLRPGERKTGLILTVAEGAALLVGRVIPTTEGARLPTRLRAHLVPAEPASADDALRYAETVVESDGRFGMRHLAPGRYYLLARPAPDAESSEAQPRPAAGGAKARANLCREARTAKVETELQACQRVTDYVLRYYPLDAFRHAQQLAAPGGGVLRQIRALPQRERVRHADQSRRAAHF